MITAEEEYADDGDSRSLRNIDTTEDGNFHNHRTENLKSHTTRVTKSEHNRTSSPAKE
jgi:hypothetical protein